MKHAFLARIIIGQTEQYTVPSRTSSLYRGSISIHISDLVYEVDTSDVSLDLSRLSE